MRLLCADDEEDVRVILELALSLDPDIEVDVVSSGSELLERAQRQDQTYDGILVDTMMPDMDGYETCRRLKANPKTADIPVIFLTAKTQDIDKQRARQAGATASLEKPFDPLTIAGRVRNILGK